MKHAFGAPESAADRMKVSIPYRLLRMDEVRENRPKTNEGV
jgi:hypothetical protein